ncbi:hypothetical protein HY442_01985 [Candidatus Parcubacteria bacterium]|nr:hypothetical protein [Candidatus Parcubacteria bacterium]MBI4385670.1 hypothetical protein [Candidatus Parcubacteria bacterium]
MRRLLALIERQDETVRRQLLFLLMAVAGALAAALLVMSLQRTFRIATGEPAPASSGTLPSIPQSLSASARDLWGFLRAVAGRPRQSAPPAPALPEFAPRNLPIPE